METTSASAAAEVAPRPLSIVGGHLALDFANTVDDPFGPLRWDHIADYPALVAWSEQVGVLSASDGSRLVRAGSGRTRDAAAVVRRAAALRGALNELFGALVDGRDIATGWAQLRPFVGAAVDHLQFLPEPAHPVPSWEFIELDSPLWPIAESAHRLLTDAELARLKRCAACPWLFLDHSKNRSRRWCSMEDCGTHEKIRRYVNKRAGRSTD